MNGMEDKRPYAAAANVVGVLQRARTRNLPDRIDNDFLRLAGVPEVVFGRVANALLFLGFTDEDQRPTETLTALSAAPDEKYRELLAGALRVAYRPDFERIDPTQDTQTQIIDAFRPYQPRSQTQRMVMLFLALCREAGIAVKDAPRERSGRSLTGKAPKKAIAPVEQRPRRGRSINNGADDGLPAVPAALLFGITEDDIGVLDDDQFAAVWNALGTVARARAGARARAATTGHSAVNAEDRPDGEEV